MNLLQFSQERRSILLPHVAPDLAAVNRLVVGSNPTRGASFLRLARKSQYNQHFGPKRRDLCWTRVGRCVRQSHFVFQTFSRSEPKSLRVEASQGRGRTASSQGRLPKFHVPVSASSSAHP